MVFKIIEMLDPKDPKKIIDWFSPLIGALKKSKNHVKIIYPKPLVLC